MKNLLRLQKLSSLVIVTGIFFAAPVALTQEELPPAANDNTTSIDAPSDGVYFSDVLVRNRPVFQVGSLADLSAIDRAEIINRRIASLLAQTEEVGEVTVNLDPSQNVATLRVSNRVLMTVTEQDAQDFGLDVEALAQRWAERLNEALEQPPLAIDVGQRLYETTRTLLRSMIANLPSLIGALIVVVITWGVASGVRYAAFRWAQQTEGDTNTEILIGRLSYGGVWVLGSVIALGILGLDFGALLGALGLTSVAIGFSLKDVLSNYISGVILLAARPFAIRDQVVIGDYEGTITQIQLRATTMKTYDGRLVYIPNQEVFQASIINNTASPVRRSSVIVGIDYGEDIEEAKSVIMKVLNRVKEIEKEPASDVLIKELGTSTVNLEARFWVNSKWASYLSTTSVVAQSIKEALEQASIDMPTDIYTLVFRNSPPKLGEEFKKAIADSQLQVSEGDSPQS